MSVQLVWIGSTTIESQDWTCGWCQREVASNAGWAVQAKRAGYAAEPFGHIALCPRCWFPTFLAPDSQVPGARFGERVEYLPEDVGALYEEACRCMSVHATTAAVLLGRKLLMHVAVENGAAAGASFKKYVEHLAATNVVTAAMSDWVNEIRELGNDANHELVQMTRAQAEELLTFVTMLLKVVYEYPEKGRRSVAARSTASAEGKEPPTVP